MSKYIFITGGVVSGLGKGITAAALGALIKSRGYSVEVIKFNPFFNIDSSNLCPKLYGETFVTRDGRACDLVIGHYERLLDEDILAKSDITSGEIYNLIIQKERENFYDGTTVQVVPHITDEIKRCVMRAHDKSDVVIVEVGGTVGDIEAQPYMEAIRQLKANLGKGNVAYVHVSLIPYIDVSGEQKTKPTQHSVRELQNMGIQPDVIVCRTDYPLGSDSRSKLSLFCNVEKDCIIESQVTPGIYEIPMMLERKGLCSAVLRKLKLEDKPADLSRFAEFCERLKRTESDEKAIKIGLVDKNADRIDVNMSLRHALMISSAELLRRVEIVPIGTDEYRDEMLDGLDGVIVAPDVSEDSLGAKAEVIGLARNRNLPILILGDAAVLGLFLGEKSITHAKIGLVLNSKNIKAGQFLINFEQNSLFSRVFGAETEQRFWSRISVSKQAFAPTDLTPVGVGADGAIAAYEQRAHRFFAGAFFRPELLARPGKPSPIISAFLVAAQKSGN